MNPNDAQEIITNALALEQFGEQTTALIATAAGIFEDEIHNTPANVTQLEQPQPNRAAAHMRPAA